MSDVSIQMVELLSAEKFLRQLVAGTDCDPFHKDKQQHQIIKNQAR